jgi:D-3-phosphoglycerate dehydrogenase
MMPHLGANTFEANFNAARKSAEQIVDYFEKGVTTAVVNKSLPDGLDAKYQYLAYVLASLTRAYLGTDKNPARVETSFYGTLGQFANWMTPAIAAAICGNSTIDRSPRDAGQALADAGVELVNREVDNKKNYGASMSIDIFAGDSPIYKGGCRGTIIENKLMISRLNDFDGLYLDPVGCHLFVEYADEPGVIGAIAGILGEKNINIIDIRAPQDTRSGRSLSVITTNVEVPDMLVEKIRETVNATRAFRFSYFA